MTRWRATAMWVCAAGVFATGCQLKRPDVVSVRMIEPHLIEPDPASLPAPHDGNGGTQVVVVRLLETESRAHIGRRLLHQEPNGELVEDAAWRWSSAPSRYLDAALRLALSSSPDVRLVDSGNATAIAVTLITWHLERGSSVRLVGAIEVVSTGIDRSVHARVIRGSEPISAELPGDLAAAAGRLLQTLAAETVTRATGAAGR